VAYDARHKSIIAHAVALTGGNVAATARWIAENSVECGEVSESTIRRLIRDGQGFTEMVAESGKAIAEERETAARLAERERLKRDMEGSFGDHIAAMERTWYGLVERLSVRVSDPNADPREMMAVVSKLQEAVLRMKTQAIPAIAETWQAEGLINAYQKVLLKQCGPALAQTVQREVGKEFQLVLAARQATAAEAEHGAQTPAPGA